MVMTLELNKIYQGDCLEVLKSFPDESVDCVVTSPPYYGLRDYGVKGQIGLETTFQEYINKLCDIFDEVKRVLKPKGTCWVNMGDTYNGNKTGYTDTNKNGKIPSENLIKKKSSKELKEKTLCSIPARFSIEMCDRGWILRNEIIWYEPNVMPQSVKDRFTVDFEKIFFFVKNKKYWFETQYEPHESQPHKYNGSKYKSIGKTSRAESDGSEFYNPQGRNKRSVWKISTRPYKESHFATFPEALIETPIKAGCPENGIVLDPFMGAGTTGVVALKLNRSYIGIELNPEYIELAEKRIEPYKQQTKLFA